MSKSVSWEREPDSHGLMVPGSCRLTRVACRQASTGTTMPPIDGNCGHGTENKVKTTDLTRSCPLAGLWEVQQGAEPSAEDTSKIIELNLEYDFKKKKKKIHWFTG